MPRHSAPRAARPAYNPTRQRLRSLTTMLLIVATIVYLNGCGGGGGAGSGSGASNQSPGNPTEQATDLATARKVYEGTPRTPPGFYTDTLPPGVTGTVATVHLKNTDLAGASGATITYELCHDDMAQAMAWSESKSTFMGSYADLVDVTGTPRYWEMTRVPRSDVSARLRHRVFKCAYVDRASANNQIDSGPAGTLNQRPVDGDAMRNLTEYLWYFTPYNNADHVVLDSLAASAAAGSLAHAITMARLTRASVSGDCDRIDLLRWTHTSNSNDGTLSRTLETTRSYRARRVNGSAELCAG